MKRVGVSDLKDHLSRHLRDVQRGVVIEVTVHGRALARIVPVDEQQRLSIRPALRPFSEIAHRRYPPLELPVSSVELLRRDRDAR